MQRRAISRTSSGGLFVLLVSTVLLTRTAAVPVDLMTQEQDVQTPGLEDDLSVKDVVVRMVAKRQGESEVANLEPDRPTSRKLNYLQTFLYNYLEPKPIVDTIREEEKYGNEGDVLGGVGRGLVSGAETLTVLLSQAVDYPGSVFRSVLRRLSESLNNVGSRLVGL